MLIIVVGAVIWILISAVILVDGMRNRCDTLRDKLMFVAIWAVLNCGPIVGTVMWIKGR